MGKQIFFASASGRHILRNACLILHRDIHDARFRPLLVGAAEGCDLLIFVYKTKIAASAAPTGTCVV